MNTTVTLSVPKLYAPLLSAKGSRVAVEHARLNCRMIETVMSLAFRDLMDGKSVVVFVGSEKQRAAHVLSTLFTQCDEKASRFSSSGTDSEFTSYRRITGAEIWLVTGAAFHREELPFTRVDVVYGVATHAISTDLTLLIPEARQFLAGELADRDHWFYDYARREDTKLLRFNCHQITETWRDQATRWLPKNDPFYERAMELRDVEPKFTTSAFMGFARRRLKIRTDKVLDYLSDRQKSQGLTQAGMPVVAFDVSQLQRRYLASKRAWKKRGFRFVIVIKYRRGGITTIEQGESYSLCVQQPRTDCITLAHTTKSTRRIVRIAKLMHEKDPERPRLTSPSKTSLEFANGSLFFIGTAGGTGEARGDTLGRFHGSEVAKWCRGPNQMEDVADLVAGLTGAAEHGEGTLETTPDGREWTCAEYEAAKRGQSIFGWIFLRWFDDPMNRCKPGDFNAEEILETLTDDEKLLVARHGLDVAQIAFRRRKQKQYGPLFKQEMPEDDATCFLTTGTCFFDTDVSLTMIEKLPESEGRVIHHPGGEEIRWKEPEAGRLYVAGCDTSEGLPGCDPNGVGILDKETGEQVASIHGLFRPDILGDHAVRLCTDYNRALLGIERENHGHAVIQRVVALGYRKPHFRGGPLFYYDRKQDVKKSRAGWSTNETSRPVMLNDLYAAVCPREDEGGMIIHDRVFLNETLTFRLQHDGKFSADPGAHDDSVMKWAVAWQMRKYHRPKPTISVIGADGSAETTEDAGDE